MDLSYEKVLIEQHASESPGIFIPDTPAKSIPMARTLISFSNGEGIPTFKSLVHVPVSLHIPLTEQCACNSSNKMSSPLLAPMTPSKSRSAQHCSTQEVVDLDSEEVKELDMSQNVVIEGRMDVSLSSDDNEEVEEIDLNKTPRKKAVRRKKHRPRVIQEDKPIKTPAPVTPEIAEHKNRPITKKTYVRKKKAQNCLDIRAGSSEKSKEQAIPLKTYIRKRKILNPSEMLGTRIGETAAEYVDQLSKSTTKSARRTLDFGSKGEAIDERQVSTVSDVKCAAFEHFDGNTAVWNREFNVQFVQGMEVKVTRSPVGFAFDLNRSLNEVLDEYIKLPENPTQSVQTTENGMNMMSDQKQYACCGYSDIIIINDIEKTGTKKDHDHISVANHCSVEDSLTQRCFMLGNNETKPNRPFQETSGLSPYLPMIYRRRRTQRPKISRSFSFEDARRSMNFNMLHQLELTLPSTQRATRKRSKILTQDHKRIPIAGAEDCDHLLCSPENKNYGTQACIDALFADARFKVTTKRRRNKGHFHFVSSMLSSRKQECEIASSQFNFPQSPFVIGLTASRSNHWKYLNGIQFCSGIQRIVSSLDPVDVIAEKMKHMKLSDVQIKNTSEASNALVSYRGGSTMVPYVNLFDMIKKQRPRAKVNLDPETNRVWNLLMGKKSNGETDGVNADKEKWWEGERDVFRGRADAFIARMHLILGDRRFSKWNGSVVDSVVGVFLTQNVSDHLSSSAFMSLAARYPLRSCDSKEANEQKMNMLTERGDGNVSSLSDTKAIDQSSVGDGEKDKETADVHGSLGSNNRNGTYHSKENELNINGRVRGMGSNQAPQNMMVTAVTTTEIMELEAAAAAAAEEEDGMLLEGAIFSKTEHVGIENVSALNEGLGSCLLPSASGITESNDINIIRSGIGPQRMPPIFTTATETQIIDLIEEDRMTLEGSILSKTQHVRKENVSVLNEGLGSCLLPSASEITSSSDVNVIESGIGSRRMPSNFTTTMAIQIIDSAEEDRMVLEDSISSKTQHVGKENITVLDEGLGSCLMPSASEITLSNDISIIASGIGSQRMPSNFTNTMATQIIDLTEEDRMTLEDVISSKNEHVEMENVSMLNKGLGPCLLSSASEIIESYDVDIIESSIAPQMAVELHETRSKLSVDASTCSNPQICLGKYIICHDDLPSEKIVGLLKQNDSHGLPQARDEQPVEILKNCQAENTCMEVDTEETVYPSLCNDIKERLETVMEAEINLKSEVRTSQTAESKKEKSASRTEKVNAKTENTKMFDWENLRREALSNSDKNKRSRETMDSLDWEAVREADVDEISKTIRERGMNNVLAGRIKDFLDRLVKDHGSIDLEWLRNVPPDRAKEYLLSIHGIGLKSVECVRLLTLHHLAFPVDTNVGRICVRLGWVPLQPLPESLQLHLLELYPMIEHIQKYLWPRLCKLDQRTLYELHYQMITFGKVFCTKTKPNCNACPMRGECKHFASAFASARLALPGPEEKRIVTSRIPSTFENGRSADTMPLLQLEGTQPTKGSVSKHCEPIIEEPASPEHICTESLERDIEDAFYEDPEDIPTIKLSLEDFKENLKNYVEENNMEIQDGDMSKALVAITAEAASIPMPKLKNVNRLRTEHQVYELPDAHPLLEGMDQRVPDDPCPYLLAIWTPGETAQSMEPPQSCSRSQDSSKLCGRKTCFACDSLQEARAQTVRGTLLVNTRNFLIIPCRTAMKGSFPLNGTYFQVNEVFADHRSSRTPIDVPRGLIWNLPRRTVFFGTTVSTIFRGLTLEEIQHCFWRGFVCVRGFDRASRAPRPLYARLHCPPSRAVKNKKTPTNDDKGNTSSKIL